MRVAERDSISSEPGSYKKLGCAVIGTKGSHWEMESAHNLVLQRTGEDVGR